MALRPLLWLSTALAIVAGCGGGSDGDEAALEPTFAGSTLSGRIEADGARAVAPFTRAAAERFRQLHPDVRFRVGVSTTARGFERFCRDETDLSNASRPVTAKETYVCDQRGIEFVEFQVANSTSSRPLFVYAKTDSLDRREVKAFVRFMLHNSTEIARAVGVAPLTDEQHDRAKTTLADATPR